MIPTTHDESPLGSTDNPGSDPAPTALATPSDLARRVTHRRTELGVTVEDLAASAGMDPTYLSYFERNASARLSAGTLNLIALALDTTPTALHGGDVDRPAGRGRGRGHPSLELLTREQCDAHLAAGGVGRIVFSTERGPIALPVNFEYTGGFVLISTDSVKADLLESLDIVGFEIDRVDEAMSEGWSVLVSGSADRISDSNEELELASLDLEGWAGGDRHALVRIAPNTVTGRVIVHEPAPDED